MLIEHLERAWRSQPRDLPIDTLIRATTDGLTTGGGTRFSLVAKMHVNPDHPTPPGMGYAMINPLTTRAVIFDDCKLETGRLFEFKGYYSFYTKNPDAFKNSKRPTITERWLNQSMNQINASEGRPITWLFSNQMDADYAEKIFLAADAGRERIGIEVLPWDRMRKWWIGITT